MNSKKKLQKDCYQRRTTHIADIADVQSLRDFLFRAIPPPILQKHLVSFKHDVALSA